MKRQVDKRINDWFYQEHPKPLVIRGARQVGKSTLVRNFARDHNLELFEINLENYPEMNRVFETRSFDHIMRSLESAVGKSFNIPAKKGLIFLDEIQATPAALTALRQFYESPSSHLPVVAAGSLLEFTLSDYQYSMPVGRIEFLHMGPMNFSEFLLALGHEFYLTRLESYHIGDKLDPISVQKLEELFRLYLFIGGMPEAVLNYSQKNSLIETQKIQQFIIDTFRADFSKYKKTVGEKTLRHITRLFDHVPQVIGKKFIYAHVDPDVRIDAIKSALEMLLLARIVHKVNHSSSNGLPLAAERDDKVFKPLFLDVGLMNRIGGITWQTMALLNQNKLLGSGAIAEQFVGQSLLYKSDGIETPSLFYWHRETKSSSAEVDFVIPSGNLVVPIEVKSGKSGRMKSLTQMAAEKKLNLAVRFDLNEPVLFSVERGTNAPPYNTTSYKILSLPIYMVDQLDRLLMEYQQEKESEQLK